MVIRMGKSIRLLGTMHHYFNLKNLQPFLNISQHLNINRQIAPDSLFYKDVGNKLHIICVCNLLVFLC